MFLGGDFGGVSWILIGVLEEQVIPGGDVKVVLSNQNLAIISSLILPAKTSCNQCQDERQCFPEFCTNIEASKLLVI